MSNDDFDDDEFARPPRPLRAKRKRVQIHHHSQHTTVEFDETSGSIRIECSIRFSFGVIEDNRPPDRFDDGFTQPPLKRLPKRRKR